MIQNDNYELTVFLDQIISLLKTVNECGPILFSIEFRENYNKSLKEVTSNLKKLKDREELLYPEDISSMKNAGLIGNQLKLKLDSFESSLIEFEVKGGTRNLEHVLGKGGVILGSLAGAIPGFGSFAQELIDFILREIKRRGKFWRSK